jgi:hypothetical protein
MFHKKLSKGTPCSKPSPFLIRSDYRKQAIRRILFRVIRSPDEPTTKKASRQFIKVFLMVAMSFLDFAGHKADSRAKVSAIDEIFIFGFPCHLHSERIRR